MEEKQTEQDTRELLHGWASRAAAHANREAKASTGWKKWLYAAAAIIAGAVAWFTTGCTASYTQTAAGDISAKVTIVEPQPYCK